MKPMLTRLFPSMLSTSNLLQKKAASGLPLAASLFVASMAITTTSHAQQTIPIGEFSKNTLAGWEDKSFKGTTVYALKSVDEKQVLQATSNDAASGIAKRITIDLTKTPYLNWSWKIKAPLGDIDETAKSGDDYPARIYVIIDGGWQFWKTLALNYVWSSNQEKGSTWDNAFAGANAKMIAVNGKSDPAGVWITQKVNVLEDLKASYTDEDLDRLKSIDAVAIMTDTDNSHQSATAWYGDIYFTDK